MGILELLPVLAILAGLVSVVVMSLLILGGYGLLLCGVILAAAMGSTSGQTDGRKA